MSAPQPGTNSEIASAPAVRGSRRLPATCAVCAIAGVTWAFWPLRAPVLAIAPKPLDLATMMPPAKPRSLELAAFRTPLWVSPPPPPAPPAPPAPPPPLRLQLIAIVSDVQGAKPFSGGVTGSDGTSTRAALLYDPDQDKLFTVRQGEMLSGRMIERITENDVRIRDGAGTRTLALRADLPSTPSGNAGGRP